MVRKRNLWVWLGCPVGRVDGHGASTSMQAWHWCRVWQLWPHGTMCAVAAAMHITTPSCPSQATCRILVHDCTLHITQIIPDILCHASPRNSSGMPLRTRRLNLAGFCAAYCSRRDPCGPSMRRHLRTRRAWSCESHADALWLVDAVPCAPPA